MYLVRRHLGMSWQEWRALPWHEQRALRDGLHADFGEPEIPASDDDELRALGVNFT